MLLEKHYTDLKDLIRTNPSIGMFNDEVFTSLKLERPTNLETFNQQFPD